MGAAHQREVMAQSEYCQTVAPKDIRVNNPCLELGLSLFSKYLPIRYHFSFFRHLRDIAWTGILILVLEVVKTEQEL